MSRPGRGRGAGFAQHPFADRHDQAGLLGDRDEHLRRDGTEIGIVPAQERLEAVDAVVVQPRPAAGRQGGARRWRGPCEDRPRCAGVPAGRRPSPARRSGSCCVLRPWRGRGRGRRCETALRRSSPSWGETAMPMLAPIEMSCPSTTNGSAIERTMRRASTAASSSCSRGPISTANSSPPSRAALSDPRQHARRRSRGLLEHGVAEGVPERVVDRLEVVEVDAEKRHDLAAADASVGGLHVLAELLAVGQVGQRIMAGEVANPRLAPPLLGDVLVGRYPAAVGHRVMQDLRRSGRPGVRRCRCPRRRSRPARGDAGNRSRGCRREIRHARSGYARMSSSLVPGLIRSDGRP